MANKTARNYLIDRFEVFQNDVFGDLRTLYVNDRFYFVGRDVAEALGYGSRSKNKNASKVSLSQAIRKNVSEEHKISVVIPTDCSVSPTGKMRTNGANTSFSGIHGSKTTLIDEAGMFQLIMRSTLPDAEVFQRWVLETVLPGIREYGWFAMGMEDLDAEEKTEICGNVDTYIPTVSYREFKVCCGDEYVICADGTLCRRKDALSFGK